MEGLKKLQVSRRKFCRYARLSICTEASLAGQGVVRPRAVLTPLPNF